MSVMKNIIVMIQAMLLSIFVQGCWAESNEAPEDLTSTESSAVGKIDSNASHGSSNVCDFILEKNRENSLNNIFERTKYLRPGLFMFDISKHVESGEGKAVIAE